MSEIFARGPVAAVINAEPIVNYRGGVFTDSSHSQSTNHIVSIVGWGKDEETGKQHWIIRNSWGQYWGGEWTLDTDLSVCWHDYAFLWSLFVRHFVY